MKSIIGKRIKGLRELLGLTQTDVARVAGVSKEYISMVEAGKRLPSLEILTKFSESFKKDMSYFLSEEKEPFTALFRSTELGKDERLKINKFLSMVDNYSFLEKIGGQSIPLAPTWSEPSNRERNFLALRHYAERLAESERNRLGLGQSPIKDIFTLLEAQGLHIIKQKMEGITIDGIFIYSPEKGAFCLINSSLSPGRQSFTAAHEYCHYLKDRDKGFRIDRDVFENYSQDKKYPLELIANIFASTFLMPEKAIEDVIQEFRNHIGPEEVIYLKRLFGVSYQAMVYRLKNLKMIKEHTVEELLQVKPLSLEKFIYGESAEEVQKDVPEKPERFVKLALDAYLTGQISLGRLAELLEIDQFSLRDALIESGITKERALIEKGTH